MLKVTCALSIDVLYDYLPTDGTMMADVAVKDINYFDPQGALLDSLEFTSRLKTAVSDKGCGEGRCLVWRGKVHSPVEKACFKMCNW